MNHPFNPLVASDYSIANNSTSKLKHNSSTNFSSIMNLNYPIHIVPSSNVSVPTIIVAPRPLSRQELDQLVISTQTAQSYAQPQNIFMQSTSLESQIIINPMLLNYQGTPVSSQARISSNPDKQVFILPLKPEISHRQVQLLNAVLQSYRIDLSQNTPNIQPRIYDTNQVSFQNKLSSSAVKENISHDKKSLYYQQTIKDTTKVITKKLRTPLSNFTVNRRLNNDQQKRDRLFKKSKIVKSGHKSLIQTLKEKETNAIKQECL